VGLVFLDFVEEEMKTLKLLAVAVLILAGSLSAIAQSDSPGANGNSATGFPENGAFEGSAFDSVQMNNGNLHLQIRFLCLPQRGHTECYLYSYDNRGWYFRGTMLPNGGTIVHPFPELLNAMQWRMTGSTGSITAIGTDYWMRRNVITQTQCGDGSYDASGSCSKNFDGPAGPIVCGFDVAGFPIYGKVYTNYVLFEPNGTKHAFTNPNGVFSVSTDPHEQCPNHDSSRLYATDGSGWVIDQNDGIISRVISKNGAQLTFGDGGGNGLSNMLGAVTATDRNGNSLFGDGRSLPQYWSTDPNTGVSTLTYYDSSGTTQNINVSFVSVPVQTHLCPFSVEFGCTNEYHYAFTQPSVIQLPNGLSYQFTYEQSQYGEPNSVTLPSGGTISWTWGALDQGGRRVISRTETVNGNAATWNYSWGDPNSPTGIWQNSMVDPNGNETVYTCQNIPSGFPGEDGDPSCTIVKVRYYRGRAAGGALLKTITTDYCAAYINTGPCPTPLPIRETTTLNDTNQISKVETDWDSSGSSVGATWRNPIEHREYDWGNGAPGALVRRTHYNYLHLSNQTYQSLNLANLPSSVVTYDGNGNVIAQTTNSYDGGTLSATSGVSAHDYTNFSASNTTRGNLTQTSHWRNTDGVWVGTSHTYDDLGNMVSSTDPNGNKTSFSYADNWANSSCVPAGVNTQAYVTQVTNALNQKTQTAFYPCTGRTQSVKDQNDINAGRTGTAFAYDLVNRPLTIDHTDGGHTSICYSEISGAGCYNGGNPLQVVTTKKLTSSLSLISTVVRDGLGRTAQTQINSDPQGTDYVDTTYDTLDRVATVSNPYRSTSDPTYGITQTQYDALGRVTQVTKQDGSVSTVSYTGNCTTATDEAGNPRKSCSDALGRLIEVDEPGGGAPATPGSGSATVNGSVQVYNLNGVAASGSVTIGGPGEQVRPATTAAGSVNIQQVGTGAARVNQPYEGCVLYDNDGGGCLQYGWIDNWVWVYDSGQVTVGAGSCSKSVAYDSSTVATTLPSALATAINADGACVVSASVNGAVINLTSKVSGAAGNYSIVASSYSNDSQDFSPPTFVPSPSGASLTGGQDALYDSGTATITVNGVPKPVPYGQGSTAISIAGALATAIAGDTSYPATATQNGAIVNLTARAAGTAGNSDGLGAGVTYNSGAFSQPSFTATASGGSLTGGLNGQLIYDAGTVTLTVAGCTPFTVNYQNGSSGSSVASALRDAVNNSTCPVTASVSGSQVNIAAKGAGSGTNYALSSSSATSVTQYFTAPSFTLPTAGLSGGQDATPASISTPAVTLYTYDTLGNLTCVEQHGNVTGTGCSAAPSNDATSPWRVRRFTYNSLSQLLSAKNPESGTLSYSYDADGNLLQKISPAPNQTGSATQTISYCYDALHRVTGKAYSAQTCTNGLLPASTAVVSYTYDTGTNGIGRMTSLTDQAGSGMYSYNAMGRIAGETRVIAGVSKSMSYEYNLDGSLKILHYPSGAAVTYTPDAAGHMLSAVDNGNNINYAASATYGPDGSLTGFVSGNVITNSFSFNKRLQPVFMSASAPSQTVFSIGYDFHFGADDNDNVFAILNNRDHTRDQTFTYDPLNRLTSAQNAGTDCSQTTANGKSKFWGNGYTYDAWGNLIAKGNLPGASSPKCNPESLDRAADAQNRLHVKTGADFQYDAAGNMTYDTDGLYYSYDPENRIAGAAGYNYTYDADGNRVEKSTGGTSPTGTLYWNMAPGIVAESDLTGALKSEYVFFDGTRVARRDGVNGSGGVFYYFSDRLKTASVITDAAGNIRSESDYFPWGGELQFINNDSNHYKFTGKERDSETGLDYFGARYYGNALGRFLTPDWAAHPIAVPYANFGNPQSLNLYSYVENNPTTMGDPDGHCDNRFCQAVKEQLHIQAGVVIGTAKFVGNAIPGVQAVHAIQNAIHVAKVGNAGMAAEAHATINTLRTVNAAAMGNEKAATQILTAANNAWNNASTTDKSSFVTQAMLTVASMVVAGQVSGPSNAGEVLTEGTIFRSGGTNPSNITGADLSFRDSLSNPINELGQPDGNIVFKPGGSYFSADVSKLPEGSAVLDNTPPGHVTVNAAVDEIKAAAQDMPKGKFPKEE
jgi:RHS repeat-associated protein